MIGGTDNSISGSGSGSTIVAGFNNDIVNAGSYSGIFAGHEHGIGSGGGHHGILAGENSQIDGEYNNAILGGINCSIGWGESNLIGGSNGASISNAGSGNLFILGSQASSYVGTTYKSGILSSESVNNTGDARFSLTFASYQTNMGANSEFNAIGASTACNIVGNYPNRSVIFGSSSSNIDNTGQDQNNENSIITSQSSNIYLTAANTIGNSIFTSYLSTISGDTDTTAIIASSGGTINVSQGYCNTILGSATSTISGGTGSNGNLIVGADNVRINLTTGDRNGIILSNTSNISGTTGTNNLILNSSSSNISGTSMSRSMIIGSSTSVISGNNTNSLIMNSSSSRITGTTGSFNLIMNSSSAIIGGTGSSVNNAIFNSPTSVIRCNLSDENTIIGGYGHFISGTTDTLFDNIIEGGLFCKMWDSNASSIHSSSGTTLSGGNQTAVIAVDRQTILTPYSATTYMDNIHTFKQTTTRVQPVVSGITFTIDADGGGKSQVYITGSSTIDIVNVKDGSSFLIKTQTDGNHTITWSSTGYTLLFAGGTHNPGNNVIDIFRFEVFGSVIYGQRIHDFS